MMKKKERKKGRKNVSMTILFHFLRKKTNFLRVRRCLDIAYFPFENRNFQGDNPQQFWVYQFRKKDVWLSEICEKIS